MRTLFSILALTVAFATSAFAGSLEKDIRKLKDLAFVGTNGGEANVSKYDVSKFDYNPKVKDLLDGLNDNGCGFAPIIGRTRLLETLSDTHIYEDNSEEVKELLVKLIKDKKVKAAIGYYWPRSEGDFEYCGREDLNIYFTNGEVLSIFFDSTT